MTERSHILVVDDDPTMRDVLSELLADDGYQVSTAVHGREALDRLAGGSVDLILLDMLMPELDGWGFAQAYRQLPGPHAPIIVTAATDAVGRARQIGAAAACGKPFDFDRLLGLITELTNRYYA
jgi:two-component system, NtrC family, response regulator AtoC